MTIPGLAATRTSRLSDPLVLAALPIAGYYLGRAVGLLFGAVHVTRLTQKG